jgi:hypothetical protein
MGITDKDLLFYKIMNYSVPKQKEFFYFGTKTEKLKEIDP